jgi:hypothetical protein
MKFKEKGLWQAVNKDRHYSIASEKIIFNRTLLLENFGQYWIASDSASNKNVYMK